MKASGAANRNKHRQALGARAAEASAEPLRLANLPAEDAAVLRQVYDWAHWGLLVEPEEGSEEGSEEGEVAPPDGEPERDRRMNLETSLRLDAIEALYLADPEPNMTRLCLELQERGLKADRVRVPPMAGSTARWYCAEVKKRIRRRAAVDSEASRRLMIRRLDLCFERALETQPAAAAGILRQRAEVDGTFAAADAAHGGTPLDQLLSCCARTADYLPCDGPLASPKGPATFWIERGLRLAAAAADSVAAFRRLGPAPAEEAARRLWVQHNVALAIEQAAQSAAITPDARREAIQKASAVYAMGTRDADLAATVEELKQIAADLSAGRAS